jgi:hypothetical protein
LPSQGGFDCHHLPSTVVNHATRIKVETSELIRVVPVPSTFYQTHTVHCFTFPFSEQLALIVPRKSFAIRLLCVANDEENFPLHFVFKILQVTFPVPRSTIIVSMYTSDKPVTSTNMAKETTSYQDFIAVIARFRKGDLPPTL